jgi:hypothetical protein
MSIPLPWTGLFPLLTICIALSKVLSIHCLSLSSQQPCEVGRAINTIPILQMGTLRHRAVKILRLVSRSVGNRNQVSQLPSPCLPFYTMSLCMTREQRKVSSEPQVWFKLYLWTGEDKAKKAWPKGWQHSAACSKLPVETRAVLAFGWSRFLDT